MQFWTGQGDPTSHMPFLFKCFTVHGTLASVACPGPGSAVRAPLWRDGSRWEGWRGGGVGSALLQAPGEDSRCRGSFSTGEPRVGRAWVLQRGSVTMRTKETPSVLQEEAQRSPLLGSMKLLSLNKSIRIQPMSC